MSEIVLDRVSTGSGSDLVRDQPAILLMNLTPLVTRSLPLPVLVQARS